MLTRNPIRFYVMAIIATFLFIACGKDKPNEASPVKDEPVIQAPSETLPNAPTETNAAVPTNLPKFTLAWSEYTTWSLLATAKDVGLINAEEGKYGELELKYNVDIVFIQSDYGKTMEQYQGGTVDAIVITNTDILSVASSRFDTVKDASVAVFPTSYSFGADKIQSNPDVKTWLELKGIPVFGDELSVTRYLHWRACILNKVNVADYPFTNLNPVDASNQFAAKDKSIRVFGGWSPETLKVMEARPEVIDLFNSSMLGKYEITDLFVVGQSALDRTGGKNAVKALAEAYTTMVNRVENSFAEDATLTAVSKNFSNTKIDMIKVALTLTIATKPDQALTVFSSPEFKASLPLTEEFSRTITKSISGPVPTAFGTKSEAPTAVLRYDTSYLP